MERKFNFEFTEQEINVIYKALQELPFKDVVGVINSINRQFNEQQMMEREQMNQEQEDEKVKKEKK